MTAEYSEAGKPTMINPRDFVKRNPVFAALPPGAFIGERFDPRYYKPVYLVPVQHRDGHVIHMLFDGQRRAALAVRDNIQEIEAVFLGEEFVQSHYPGQTAFKPAQFVELMRKLHDSKTDDRRIAAQILREWQITVGDTIDQRSSALAALFYLSFSNLLDRTPGEIETIMKTPNHSKYPGDFVFAQTKDERLVIGEGLSSMARSIDVVDVSYEDMLRHALWVVQQMIKSDDPDMQAEGRKQLRGLLSSPRVNEKITSSAPGRTAANEMRDTLESVLIETTSLIDTKNPESVTYIRLVDTILKDKYLSYDQTVAVLSPNDQKSLIQRYDDMKRVINSNTLQRLYQMETGVKPSSFIEGLFRRFSGNIILDPQKSGERGRLQAVINIVTHAVDYMRVNGLSQAAFLDLIQGITSVQSLRAKLVQLERNAGLGATRRTEEDRWVESPPVAPRSVDTGGGATVVFAESERVVPSVAESVAEAAVLEQAVPEVTVAEPTILGTATDLTKMLSEVATAEDLPDGARVVFDRLRTEIDRLYPPPIDWSKVPFNPDTDGRDARWFHDKLRRGSLSENDRHRVTLVINQAAQKKVFSQLAGSWDDLLTGIGNKQGDVGLTAIDTSLSFRLARLTSSLNWDKITPEFIFLCANHYALALKSHYEGLVLADQDAGEYGNLSRRMDAALNVYKRSGSLSVKPDQYFELLQLLLYTDFGTQSNKNGRMYVRNKSSDISALREHNQRLYSGAGVDNVTSLFDHVI